MKVLFLFFIVINIFEIQAADLSKAGYNGGGSIPSGDVIVDLQTTYNVIPDDGLDDTAAIQQAIDDYKNSGQIVVLLLPAGVINISGANPISYNSDGSAIDGGGIYIDGDGIILRGRGIDPEKGTKIVYNNPADFYAVVSNIPLIDGKTWPGLSVFRVETRETAGAYSEYPGSINFHWVSGKRLRSSLQPGTNGSYNIYLNSATDANDFSIGDTVWIGACNTVEFLSNHFSPTQYWQNDNYFARQQIFKVVGKNVDGDNNTYLVLDEPLEFDVPYSDNGKIYGSVKYSKILKPKIIKNVGFEDFIFYHSLKGTEYSNLNRGVYDTISNPNGIGFRYVNLAPKQALHTILFKWCENVWVKNVKIEVAGSHPIVTEDVRFGTFRDNIILGSWNKGKGGMGYFRGSKSFQCLFENNFISFVRHLSLQWSATGNISRYNIFYKAGDMNFHGGWERYNLVEHIWSELDYRHQSWNNEGTGPEGGTWYPLWWAASPHAGKWAGVGSGYYNEVRNSVFIKQRTPGGVFEDWGLYDTPGYTYIFGWAGSDWRHLNTDGDSDGDNIILTWEDNQLYDFTATGKGVFVTGTPVVDSSAPNLVINSPTNYSIVSNFLCINGSAYDEVAVKVMIQVDTLSNVIVWGMTNWRYYYNVTGLSNGEHKAIVSAIDGENNITKKTLIFYISGENTNVTNLINTNTIISNNSGDNNTGDFNDIPINTFTVNPKIINLYKQESFTIEYNVEPNKTLQFEVYNITGELVTTISSSYSREVNWDGNKDNRGLPSGMYFIFMRVDGRVTYIRKIGIIK